MQVLMIALVAATLNVPLKESLLKALLCKLHVYFNYKINQLRITYFIAQTHLVILS